MAQLVAGQPPVDMADTPMEAPPGPEQWIAQVTAEVRNTLNQEYARKMEQLEKEFIAARNKMQTEATAQVEKARAEVLMTAATGAPSPQDFFRAVGQDPFSRAELTRAIGHSGNPDNLPLRNGPQPEATNMLPCLKKFKVKDKEMHEELGRFLDGPPVESSGLSDHSLIRSHGLVGLVWAALADVIRRLQEERCLLGGVTYRGQCGLASQRNLHYSCGP
ncbi:hypothetical protein CDD81_3688 [Ophiocordyceps australis]|uniref:Uncharacterized protein n=1 Tax=Ophiocordyceps australis TaxID=1399860 RepID=A0A2C5XRT0_9HYPO|nr:hypothetical protein CDD81_3688 [Ophiocordyceps australis]